MGLGDKGISLWPHKARGWHATTKRKAPAIRSSTWIWSLWLHSDQSTTCSGIMCQTHKDREKRLSPLSGTQGPGRNQHINRAAVHLTTALLKSSRLGVHDGTWPSLWGRQGFPEELIFLDVPRGLKEHSPTLSLCEAS